MRSFFKLLISSLMFLLRLAADRLGIVKYATSTNAWLWGSKGIIERMVLYNRLGQQEIRTRAHHFNIKDVPYWKGRFDRFRDFMRLGRSTNYELDELYETKPAGLTFFNLLIRQMNKFWAGGPAPAPYVFSPGAVEVGIGNGTMPDARDVVITPMTGGVLKIDWDPACVFPDERDDDVLQLMLITKDGSFGVWLPKVSVIPGPYAVRSDGSCTWTVPEVFLNTTSKQAYCAVKFKAGAELAGKVKGIFKYPLGITPVTLIP